MKTIFISLLSFCLYVPGIVMAADSAKGDEEGPPLPSSAIVPAGSSPSSAVALAGSGGVREKLHGVQDKYTGRTKGPSTGSGLMAFESELDEYIRKDGAVGFSHEQVTCVYKDNYGGSMAEIYNSSTSLLLLAQNSASCLNRWLDDGGKGQFNCDINVTVNHRQIGLACGEPNPLSGVASRVHKMKNFVQVQWNLSTQEANAMKSFHFICKAVLPKELRSRR